MRLDDIGETVSYGEAVDLIGGLSAEAGTHTHAAVHGWAYPLSNGEIYSQLLAVAFINTHRDRKKHPQPLEASWPWPDRDEVSPEELAHYEQMLARRSPFRD